ncbi:2-methylcitrate dehydratase PrpD [Kribbella sp. VKM Ac-2527]|uniref:2-methylcitrate dehydratase PrpD n=1 Tax=Kribbella caucasensis TaxID=2512215 RepID=A0A4R6KME8_9ACTN|nr:MmgE/PrpD family protein [Kribbella sp. VKM Ac-2527]TDO51575.1 2-methylcitrate dehydratase PrpD [Kribbella sp. VKM Ac-2527]
MSVSKSHELAQFVSQTSFDALPSDVVHETKRILLDSIGCALAAGGQLKGRAGIEYAQLLGGMDSTATIFGSSQRSSILGAAFANGELINALDFDAVLPPGHVSPYVLPGALAVAEAEGSSGKQLITAIAIAHELANRFGKAMDYIRDVRRGEVTMPPVLGYTSTVFGAAAAIASLWGASEETTRHALNIAGAISPVNSHRSWLEHTPVATIKYTMAGPLVHSALTAAYMASLGHRGDPNLLDDSEFGYPRFIGTSRWQPEALTAELGQTWSFQRENSFKHYPHCRALHGLLDLLGETVESHSIDPSEIDEIRAWGEGHVERASWLTNEISDPVDAQFSIAHGLSVGAHRIPPSKAWQDEDVVFDAKVAQLMGKVVYARHPDWVEAMVTDPAARPSRIEIDARGETFVAELRYPKGTNTDDSLGTADDDLFEKFRVNAMGVLDSEQIEHCIATAMSLETVEDVSTVLKEFGRKRG